MSKTYPDWISYWKDVAVKLEGHIRSQRDENAESYIKCCFAFFSFVTEDFVAKATKNNDHIQAVTPMVIELQDILRATFMSQSFLTLATSAFNLRAAFEIRCNLVYSYKHASPAEMFQRLTDFIRYEQIVGSRLSPSLGYEGETVEKEFASKHDYWRNKASGLLKDNADWNGEGKKLKDICDELKWQDEYFQIFKISSKFQHGSPIVRNLYQTGKGIGCVGNPKFPTMFNLLCCHNICESLMETCEFFGVDFPELEYRKIQVKMLEIRKKYGI